MEEGGSKEAALILMKNSHFDRTLRYDIDEEEVREPNELDLGFREPCSAVSF